MARSNYLRSQKLLELEALQRLLGMKQISRRLAECRIGDYSPSLSRLLEESADSGVLIREEYQCGSETIYWYKLECSKNGKKRRP